MSHQAPGPELFGDEDVDALASRAGMPWPSVALATARAATWQPPLGDHPQVFGEPDVGYPHLLIVFQVCRGLERAGRLRRYTGPEVIYDLALGSCVPAQTARPLQSPAHLVDRLAWAHAQSVREFVVIQGTTSISKFLQNACCDSLACHGRMIPHRVPVRKARY